MIVMLSEFGRTPKINMTQGRDHHPTVFSCLSRRRRQGRPGHRLVHQDAIAPKENPVNVPNLHASICHALGINPNQEVMTPLQRPMKLVDNGKPIAELFS